MQIFLVPKVENILCGNVIGTSCSHAWAVLKGYWGGGGVAHTVKSRFVLIK